MTDVKIVIRSDSSQAEQAARKVAKGFDEVKSSAADAAGASDKLAGVLTRIGHYGASAFAVAKAREFAVAIYDASVAAERVSTMLSFSSARGAAAELAYVRDLSQQLGLRLNETAAAYGSFAAAARGTALEGRQARDVFSSVASAAAVMGLSTDQAGGVLLALQQMMSKGVVSAEELRGQLGERLPGAFQIAARALGVTTQKLGDMLQAGEIIADDFLPRFAKQLREEMGAASEAAAGRLEASTNRMANAWDRLMQELGKAGGSEAARASMATLTNHLVVVSDAIEVTRAMGGGSFAQLEAGAAAAIGRLLGLHLVFDSFRTLDDRIAITTGEIKRLTERSEDFLAQLDKAGQKRFIPPAWTQEMADAQRQLDELNRAKRMLTGDSREPFSDARFDAQQSVAAQKASAGRLAALAELTKDKAAEDYAKAVRTIAATAQDGIGGAEIAALIEKQRQKLYKSRGARPAGTRQQDDFGSEAATEAMRRLESVDSVKIAALLDQVERLTRIGAKGDPRAAEAIKAAREELDKLQNPVQAFGSAMGTEKMRALEQIEELTQGYIDANARASAELIEDERARGLRLIEIDRNVALRKIQHLDQYGEAYQAAKDAIDAGATLAAQKLEQDLARSADKMSAFAEQAQRNIQDALGNTLERALEGNFKSIGQLWAQMLRQMVAQAASADLNEYLFGKGKSLNGGAVDGWIKSLGGWLSGLFGGGGSNLGGASQIPGEALGGAYSSAGRMDFASGGVVSSPTFFRFAQGASLRAGLMGEAGPEAIMPLKRGRDGKLGVSAQAGGGTTVVVNMQGSGAGVGGRMTTLQQGQVIGRQVRLALARNG